MKKLVVFPNDPIIEYYKKGEIKQRYFNSCNLFSEIHIISPAKKEIEESKVQEIAGKAKLNIYPVGSYVSLRHFWVFFKKRRKILNLVKKINPLVIRAHGSQLAGYWGIFCSSKLGIPSVVSLHINPDEHRKFSNFSLANWIHSLINQKFFEPYILSNASKVICVTHFLENYAKKYGAKNMETIYNRVYLNQFTTHRDYTLKTIPTILSVGRLDPQKNQECLIRAIKDMDVKLILIGDGINYNKLNLLARKLNISSKVKFIKSVPNNNIQKYYWNADIFAISSFYEGFCIPILEAMASGLPVVINDKEPLTEVLGSTGIVVKNTPEAFKEAFGKLIKNLELRRDLGQKAMKRAEKIDGETMEKKEANLYKQLIERA